MQERILSRRIVHFTKGQLIWHCNTLAQREDGNLVEGLGKQTSWNRIVRDYSHRKLTYAKDRLVALQGLGDITQAIRKQKYIWGMWEEDLLVHLLWETSDVVDTLKEAMHRPDEL